MNLAGAGPLASVGAQTPDYSIGEAGGSGRRIVRIAAIESQTDEISTFELIAADNKPLPPFEAGAHIDVHLPGGLVRQYSLLGDPADRDRYVIGVKKEAGGRGGSLQMHKLRPGAVIHISVPRNNFPLHSDKASESIFIAGGIGVTPVLSMIHTLERQKRPWRLYYFARSASAAAFRDHLQKLGKDRIVEHFSELPLSDFSELIGPAQPGRHIYCCGPAGLMDAVRRAAVGWQADRIHFESFTAAEIDTSGDQAFEVELARSGQVLTVPADKSILETLRDHGFDMMSSCEEGLCGSCETVLLAGVPDHRDMVMTDAEIAANDKIMICVSRAKGGRLVLDI